MDNVKLVIPASITEIEHKYAFIMEVQEKLRLAHNVKGEQFKNKAITKDQFTEWLETYFIPRTDLLCTLRVNLKQKMQKSHKYNPSLDTVFI